MKSEKYKETAKKVAPICAFLILLIIVLVKINDIFKFKYSDGIYSLKTFYELPENTVDVLVLGSSHAFEDINPAVLYEEYGIAAFDLCGSAQPLWNTYYYLKEALKSQKPQLIVLEAYGTAFDMEYLDSSPAIKNTYGMHWSKDKIEAIKASMPAESFYEFLIGPLQYHGRYIEISEEDILPYLGKEGLFKYWKGFGNNMVVSEQTMPDVSHVELPVELSEKSESYYRRVIELAQTSEIPILVVVSPYSGISDYEQGKYLRAMEIAAEYGVPFINHNTQIGEIGLNPSTDFADIAHLNYLGNRKFTEYFGRYLMENYELPDRRGEADYFTWEMNLKYYRESLQGKEIQKYTSMKEYLENIPTEDCVVIVTTTDLNVWQTISGGKTDEAAQEIAVDQYILVKWQDSLLYTDNTGEECLWHQEIEGVDFAVKGVRNGNEEKAVYAINIGLSEHQKVQDGVNVVIYNIFTGELVDAVGFDKMNGYGMVR
jgi:hypothetical protein